MEVMFSNVRFNQIMTPLDCTNSFAEGVILGPAGKAPSSVVLFVQLFRERGNKQRKYGQIMCQPMQKYEYFNCRSPAMSTGLRSVWSSKYVRKSEFKT